MWSHFQTLKHYEGLRNKFWNKNRQCMAPVSMGAVGVLPHIFFKKTFWTIFLIYARLCDYNTFLLFSVALCSCARTVLAVSGVNQNKNVVKEKRKSTQSSVSASNFDSFHTVIPRPLLGLKKSTSYMTITRSFCDA